MMIKTDSFNDYLTQVKEHLPKDCLLYKLEECKMKGDVDGMKKILEKSSSKLKKTFVQSNGSFSSPVVNSAVVGHLVTSLSSGSSYGSPCLSRSSSGGSVISGGSGINITVHPFSII